MEMRNDMPLWAPTGTQMNEIRRRVSKERAKAAADVFNALRGLFGGSHAAPVTEKVKPTGCPAGA